MNPFMRAEGEGVAGPSGEGEAGARPSFCMKPFTSYSEGWSRLLGTKPFESQTEGGRLGGEVRGGG